MKKAIIVLLGTFILTHPLFADWIDEFDGFKWGQTPEQIRENENRIVKYDTAFKDKYFLYFDAHSYLIWYGFKNQKLYMKGIKFYLSTTTDKEIALNAFDEIASDLDEKCGKRNKGKWKSIYNKSLYWKNNDNYIILKIDDAMNSVGVSILISGSYKDMI